MYPKRIGNLFIIEEVESYHIKNLITNLLIKRILNILTIKKRNILSSNVDQNLEIR